MAALHSTITSTSLLVRQRPGRVPSGGAKAAASSNARLAVAPVVSPNVSLFLTNLRLLDLDLLPDWPDISSHTFCQQRDAGHGQKKRIQCVEWALYRLFALWDAEETRNKLQPFFPPQDQAQSLNLRAALLRALEQAKKNGILGRDAVVRKTMLDDCRGERLEEVLAVFSSIVLKRSVAEGRTDGSAGGRSVARALALEDRGYSDDRTELDLLVLVHRASLSGLLRGKDAARAQFQDLSELLNLKQRSIARRREQVRIQQSTGAEVSDDAKLDTWRMVRNNWSGSERWMESLLYGDTNSRRDGLLTAPFDRVWRRMQAGRLAELEDRSSGGLLEQLDHRIKTQKDRLEQWESFRKKILCKPAKERQPLGVEGKQASDGPHRRGVDLGFGAHENLHFGRLSPRRKLPDKALRGEYAELVQELESELLQPSTRGASVVPSMLGVPARRPPPVQPPPEQLLMPEAASEDPISELSDLDEEVDRPLAVVPPPEALRPTLRPQRQSPPMSPMRRPVRTPSPVQSHAESVHTGSRDEVQVSPTTQLADQILASVNNSSPSPTKKPRHTLSLAERTRLSMFRGSRGTRLDEDDDEPEFESLSIHRGQPKALPASHKSHEAHPQHDELSNDEHEHEDLVARTRRSMAGFEAARQKAQLERRRSQRKSKLMASTSRREDSSYFPAVEEGDNTLLLAEELMSAAQEDAEAIFRSRPKIKTSPMPSPARLDY